MNLFSEILKLLLKFLLPFLVIVLVLLIINIILNYKKYGTKIFSSFKKYDPNGKMKDLVISMVKNESHKDVIIINRDDNSFYAITTYEVFAILIFDYDRSLLGNINDEYLKTNNEQILNPIPKFLNDNKNIKEKGISFTTIYIKTKKDVKLNISNFEEEIYTLKDFCYKLYQRQHSKTKYCKEEMIKIQKGIEDIINGYN